MEIKLRFRSPYWAITFGSFCKLPPGGLHKPLVSASVPLSIERMSAEWMDGWPPRTSLHPALNASVSPSREPLVSQLYSRVTSSVAGRRGLLPAVSGCDRYPTPLACIDEAFLIAQVCDSSPQEAEEGLCEPESSLDRVRPCLGKRKKKCLWNEQSQLLTPILLSRTTSAIGLASWA